MYILHNQYFRTCTKSPRSGFFRDPNLFARGKQSSERWSIRHMMLLYKKNITLRGVQTHSAVHYGRDGACRIKSQTLDVLRRVLRNKV